MTEAVIVPVERGKRDSKFDATKISPSRVNTYLGCGEAFRRYYIDGEPKGPVGSAALYGNVIHGMLEKWALDRSQDAVTLTAQSWLELTRGTAVAEFIGEYQAISVECMKAEHEARLAFEKRNPGKESKSPRMTKEFKASPAAKKLNALLAVWIPKLNAHSPWRFSERDPLPTLYDESLIASKRYAAMWNELPTALHTEFGFNVRWEGYLLNGFIDAVEPVLAPTGELAGYVIGDYKTYRNDAPGAKDWRQGAIYDVVFEALCQSGALPYDPELPRWVVFDYFRLLYRKDYRMTQADRRVLLNDLAQYKRGVEAEVFLPAHKNTNPDFCDYNETCCMRTRGAGCGTPGGLYPEPS